MFALYITVGEFQAYILQAVTCLHPRHTRPPAYHAQPNSVDFYSFLSALILPTYDMEPEMLLVLSYPLLPLPALANCQLLRTPLLEALPRCLRAGGR